MTINRIPMTVEGKKELEAELNLLKNKERPAVIAAISEARAHGDLKENAEYHAAKEQQGFIEGRIQQIESTLASAQVIDITTMKNEGKVVFGATVTVEKLEAEKQFTYKIVGDDEADFKKGKISVNAPLARALIGKLEGDEAVVQTPEGDVDYAILKVEYL